MTVWHVNAVRPSTGVDGVERAMEETASALAGIGRAVEVWTAADPLAIADLGERGDGLLVHRAASGLGVLRAALGALRDRRTRPEVVHFHSSFRPLHAVLALGLEVLRIPYVVAPHSAMHPEYLRRFRYKKAPYLLLVERPMMRRASAVMCLTDREAEDAAAACPRLRTPRPVIENPIGEQYFTTARWDLAAASPGRLVCLARHDVHMKGLDRLCEVARHEPTLDVRVHGQPDAHAYADAATALTAIAPTNFRLAPPIFGDDKLDALRAAHAYVQLSRAEGLSMSMLEAMALGVPCIVSRDLARTLPAWPEPIAVVVDDDPRTAAREIAALLDDPVRLRAIADAGRRFADARVRPASVASRLAAVYDDASREVS